MKSSVKTFTRVTSALLLLFILSATLFTSCAPSQEDSGSQDSGALVGDPSVGEESEKLVLPENMNYGGSDFFVLTAGNVAYVDFDFDEETAGFNIISEAQYRRIQTMNDVYGVKMTSERQQNNYSYGEGPGFLSIQKSVQSETVDYHLGIIGAYDVANLTRCNLLYDLNSLEWLDTSKSWWDQNANVDLAVGNLLFFTNGSLTAAYSESTFAMYFNKDLAKTVFTNGQDPYQLVKDGKWTVDALAELSRLVSEDLDGNDVINYKDRFGLWAWDDSMIGMVEAAGSKICTPNKDGTVSLSLNSENTVNMINKYASIAYDPVHSLCFQADMRNGNMTASDLYAAWGENKALFFAVELGQLPILREMETNFGILPYPKLTEDQDRYYSTIAPYNAQFICVPLYMEDTEYVGSVIEALAYYGKELVTPAVYERTLKGAYARDNESYDMLDIIFGSYGYDFGLYYRIGMYTDGLLNLLRNKSTAFSSLYEANARAAEAELGTINENFKSLIEYWSK